MRMDVNFPSVGIGVVGGLALSTLSLEHLGLFDYSLENFPWVLGSAIALGAMSLYIWKSRPIPTVSNTSIRDRLQDRFPVVAPSGLDWSEVDSSRRPDIWLEQIGGDYEAARRALEFQVTTAVIPAIYQSIMATLAAVIAEPSSGRRWIDELARRMWQAHQDNTEFDADGYLHAIKKVFPDVSSEALGNRAWESNHQVVILVDALVRARKAGVVIPASDFLWLRFYDRRLWYVFNNVGRPTFHIEGAGPIAHYQEEQRQGRPILEPQIDAVLQGLAVHFEEHGLELRGIPRDDSEAGVDFLVPDEEMIDFDELDVPRI